MGMGCGTRYVRSSSASGARYGYGDDRTPRYDDGPEPYSHPPQPTPLARAGQTVTAFLYPALTDFAVADADGERAALPGRYTVRFGLREAAAHGMGFAEAALSAVAGPLPAPVEQA